MLIQELFVLMSKRGKGGCMTSSQEVSSSFFLCFPKKFRLLVTYLKFSTELRTKIDFTNTIHLDKYVRALLKCHFTGNRSNLFRFTVDIVSFKKLLIMITNGNLRVC